MSTSRSRLKHACAALTCIISLHVVDAQAEGCSKSRDYILADGSGELPRSPRTYLDLYKSCLQTLQMPNVKDAFVLKAGAIAVLPRNDSVPATAGTLAQFCTQFPRQTLRFIAPREGRLVNNIALVVQLNVSQSVPCQKISGTS
jgi:hypothetical protein